jgi:hypothetical protein
MADNRQIRTKPLDGPKGNEEWDLMIIRGGDGRKPSKESNQ